MRFLVFHLLFKGILHPNLYEFLSSDEHKGRYFEEQLEPNSCLAPLTSMKKKKKHYGAKQLFGWSIPDLLFKITTCTCRSTQ